MINLAIFIDGGYLNNLVYREYQTRLDMGKVISRIKAVVGDREKDKVDLFQAFYYDSMPFSGLLPTESDLKAAENKKRFVIALENLPDCTVRLGKTSYRGYDQQGKDKYQQKRTDILLGLDIAQVVLKRQTSHIALVSGDDDYVPLIEFAKANRVKTWLFHGSVRSRFAACSRELLNAADESCEIDEYFIKRIRHYQKE